MKGSLCCLSANVHVCPLRKFWWEGTWHLYISPAQRFHTVFICFYFFRVSTESTAGRMLCGFLFFFLETLENAEERERECHLMPLGGRVPQKQRARTSIEIATKRNQKLCQLCGYVHVLSYDVHPCPLCFSSAEVNNRLVVDMNSYLDSRNRLLPLIDPGSPSIFMSSNIPRSEKIKFLQQSLVIIARLLAKSW